MKDTSAQFLLCSVFLFSCCRQIPVPEPFGFSQVEHPVVYSVRGSGEYAHSDEKFLPTEKQDFYFVFDADSKRITGYSSFVSPSNITSHVGIYSKHSDSFYFHDAFGGRIQAISAQDGKARVIGVIPYGSHSYLFSLCTIDGYILGIADMATDGKGFHVFVLDTRTDAFIEKELFLPGPWYDPVYDGSDRIYFALGPMYFQSFDPTEKGGIFYIDTSDFTLKKYMSLPDRFVPGVLFCIGGEVLVEGSYTDPTTFEIVSAATFRLDAVSNVAEPPRVCRRLFYVSPAAFGMTSGPA